MGDFRIPQTGTLTHCSTGKIIPDSESIKRSVCLFPFKKSIQLVFFYLIRFLRGRGQIFVGLKVKPILEQKDANMELFSILKSPDAQWGWWILHENHPKRSNFVGKQSSFIEYLGKETLQSPEMLGLFGGRFFYKNGPFF